MKKRTIVWILLAIVVLAVPAFVVFALPTIESLKVDLPKYQKPGDPVMLPQGWSDSQRTAFHYTAQGTQIMPYKWFVNLEQPCWWPFGCGKFADQEYLGRFGFIAGVKDAKDNPDGFPVGFAKDAQFRDPVTGSTTPVVGINCAACHTGELHYQNHAVRIEGGPAMTNLGQFLNAIGVSLLMTKNMPFRYARFERKVLGPDATALEKVALRQEFNAFLTASVNEVNQGNARGVYNVTEGFGRTDALARIGNIVFGLDMNNWNNLSATNAPVRFPQVWDASWFTWVQYNASISNPMARNVGEAMGVKAAAKLSGCCTGKLQSTVLFKEVWALEELLAGPAPYQGLTSPKWPGVFPPLDKAKADRGKQLYRDHCMRCHLPPPDELLDDLKTKHVYWEMRDGKYPYLKVLEIPIQVVGTDPNQALDFYNRTADSGDLGKGCMTAAEGLDLICKTMASNFYKEQKMSPEEQRKWSGHQDPNAVGIRAANQFGIVVYRPRPLNGVWALGTYLHNGSVPNIYALLSPYGERPAVFWVGSKNYDPVKIGYESTELKGAFRYDVTQTGSSNHGHEFSDAGGPGVIEKKTLSTDDRYAIIEYLKSL